jgi:hypothetical protein
MPRLPRAGGSRAARRANRAAAGRTALRGALANRGDLLARLTDAGKLMRALREVGEASRPSRRGQAAPS